jgi:hypothetical protein
MDVELEHHVLADQIGMAGRGYADGGAWVQPR